MTHMLCTGALTVTLTCSHGWHRPAQPAQQHLHIGWQWHLMYCGGDEATHGAGGGVPLPWLPCRACLPCLPCSTV
jgi:hypothetical protein